MSEPVIAAADLSQLALGDISRLERAGLKGPNAAGWLAQQGIPVPMAPNSWTGLPRGGVVARLGETEFFLQDAPGGDVAARVPGLLGRGLRGVYPVLRQDAGFILSGARANEVLLETCNVDFAAMGLDQHALALTSMVGVSILVIPRRLGALPTFGIWTDPSFGPYLWRTLLEIVLEHGGTAAAYDQLCPYLENQGDTA